jgi:hypothetical protein
MRIVGIIFLVLSWFGVAEAQKRAITVASTTSTEQSGLFGYLLSRRMMASQSAPPIEKTARSCSSRSRMAAMMANTVTRGVDKEDKIAAQKPKGAYSPMSDEKISQPTDSQIVTAFDPLFERFLISPSDHLPLLAHYTSTRVMESILST